MPATHRLLIPRSWQENRRIAGLLLIVFVTVISLNFPSPAIAAANLTITPITWGVMGLDSNDVTTGPNEFPVGARVCNTGTTAASNVVANLVWDTANANIDLQTGS